MTMLEILLLFCGLTAVFAAGLWGGRLIAEKPSAASTASEPTLTEAERRTLRELQNFFQYDGFSQP